MKNLLLHIIPFFLTACSGAAHEENLIKNYSLKAMDVESGMSIYYDDEGYLIGIIQPTVFAVGHDNDYIIAKQHPQDFPRIDKTVTNYFIIPLREKVAKSAEKNVIGPLTKGDFEAKRRELGVSKRLTFTKVFEDLE